VLGCACCALAGAADKPGYGKVDTFEPGKKYSCVPTADHKGWDCTQSGKASDAPPPSATPEPPPAAPSATAAPAAAAPAAAPASLAAPPTPAAAPTASHSGELPSYLSARAASGAPPPQQSTPAPAPAARPEVSTNPQLAAPTASREESKPAAAAAPEKSAAPAPVAATPAPQPAPAAATTPRTTASEPPAAQPTPAPQTAAPAPAETVRPAAAPVASARETRSDIAALGSDAFVGLSGEQYVIELAHAASEAGLAAPPPLPRGEVYKLHLQQNGADVWLLLWGSFDDVSAARAARAELAASAAQTPGWPRRVAPLQAEARRARD